MSNPKKSAPSKFLGEDVNDFIIKNQYLNEPTQTKKSQKRNKSAPVEEEGMSKLIVDYQTGAKKRRDSVDTSQKVRDTIGQQIESRKQCNDLMLKSLSDIITQFDADYTMMKENYQKMEALAAALVKSMQQTNAAFKQKINLLSEMLGAFKKGVEGLITRGALKPDDRPLWFDVYKAFPPLTEPKFAKPLPEIKPIRTILYEEDTVRAKFQSAGQGYGVINMLNPAGETHIKKLVKQYEKLKSEGVPESELVEKAAAAVQTQRHDQHEAAPKTVATNPESVTAQVLAEADLKNIFNEK